uniref:HTH cro/C1-type domain-containing protein n=1 Tax=Prevotella sp. GTC17262 TaxID=3236797 RepID=A0AB33JJ86_9BACT
MQLLFDINKLLGDYFSLLSDYFEYLFRFLYLRNMKSKENVTERILQIMEKEGHSTSTFARKLGISWTSANNIVSGRNMPNYENIVKIIQSFKWVDANWLIMGESSESDMDKKSLYELVAVQQRTIENQQKTIDRLTEKLVQNLPEKVSQRVTNVG